MSELYLNLVAIFTNTGADLTEDEFLKRFPRASKRRRRANRGEVYDLTWKHGAAPDVEFEFDAAGQLIRMAWSEEHRTGELATPPFLKLRELFHRRFRLSPENHTRLASKKEAFFVCLTWGRRQRDTLAVRLAQVNVGGRPQSVSILRTLKQPYAAIAAAPADGFGDLYV